MYAGELGVVRPGGLRPRRTWWSWLWSDKERSASQPGSSKGDVTASVAKAGGDGGGEAAVRRERLCSDGIATRISVGRDSVSEAD